MARLYLRNDTYTSVRSESWNESDFEEVVLANASTIFPRWTPVKFRADVSGTDGTIKRPDLALIDFSYRHWWVVEVELGHHSLVNHVLPQVEVFQDATYGEEHARYISDRASHLNQDKLLQMMLGEPPEVLVVVDRPDTNWKRLLDAMGVRLGVVEPFRGPGVDFCFRVSGYIPEPPGDVLTRLTRTRAVRRLWRVVSPAALPLADREDQRLEIEYEGTATLWAHQRTADAMMLFAEQGGDVLRGLSAVDIIKREDGSLAFRPVAQE